MPKNSKTSSKKNAVVKLKRVDWFGLNHEMVAKKFEGDLEFVNYMNVGKDGDLIAAVYHAAKPNKSKGHKEFMLLWKYFDHATEKEQWMVSGMEREEIEKHAIVDGMVCNQCNTALWSLNRHHYHTCECPNSTMVDGGKDYLRFGAKDLKKASSTKINLLTNEVFDTVPSRR